MKLIKFNLKGREVFIPIKRITKIKRYGTYWEKLSIHTTRFWETMYYKFDKASECSAFCEKIIKEIEENKS